MLSGTRLAAAAGAADPVGAGGSRVRTAVVLLAATLLPLLIYALVSIGIGYRDDRRTTEAATLARANRISDAVDARLDAVAATMRALSTIRSIRERNWVEARQRAGEIAALDPDWRDVTLIDCPTGRTVVDLGEPGLAGRVARPIPGPPPAGDHPVFSGVVRASDGRPAITAAMLVGHGAYLLRVSLDPRLVQRILMAASPREGVSAVVDRRGLFIARTRAWPRRLGTPATVYVRTALASAPSGVYHSVTYEGLESFTAFATSPRTGWSTHVAVSSELIDGPQHGWRVAAGLAGLLGLALAIALVALILRLVAVRRAADARARQTERIEAVGKLTGGIAHDFNNMLAIVIGSLDLAQRKAAKGNPDVGRHIDNAMDGARRAADLTRRLLAFSRRQPLAPAAVDLNALIGSTGELLRRTLPTDIAIVQVLEPALWPTFVDPGQLENALVNLAINARDAMPDGGTLTIATENRSGERQAEMVALVVADTGTGMTPDVAARAFEPFYTTKDVGRGTGLGLSQIHGFATQSGGEVTIASTPGRGTAVTMLFPRHAGEAAPAAERADADATAPAGRAEEIILVVEDEEGVRMTNVEALRTLGYTVRHAADGAGALAVLATQAGVRLMLTDIVMPGMNGRALAARVAERHPEVRVLLATGYEREKVEADEDQVLRKPFGLAELARRVRRELDLPA